MDDPCLEFPIQRVSAGYDCQSHDESFPPPETECLASDQETETLLDCFIKLSGLSCKHLMLGFQKNFNRRQNSYLGYLHSD